MKIQKIHDGELESSTCKLYSKILIFLKLQNAVPAAELDDPTGFILSVEPWYD